MRLSDLTERSVEGTDVEVLGLTADSRAVQPGYLFAAIPGSRADGRRFIGDAIRRGAGAILVPPGRPADIPPGVPVIEDDNPRRRLALMAARFYRHQPRHVAAVTGTNGKTSTVDFTRQIWRRMGLKAASIGTLGVIAEGDLQAPAGVSPGASMTTPDPVALQRLLAEFHASGTEHVAMEASSHGLDQFRLDGVRVTAAAFTNLTRDHLDYHPDMDSYRAAKWRLFEAVMQPGGQAVLNADSPEFEELAALCRRRGHRVRSYGTKGRDLTLLATRTEAEGQTLTLELDGSRHEVHVPLAGAFQGANLLCALGLVIAEGGDPTAALAAVPGLAGVKGRMERVARHASGAPVYIDYAHTPDALETVLKALRPHCASQLVVVFGCGGDRDPGKRPLMGAIAGRLADAAIVTDDNPRTEDPAAIRAEILAGCAGNPAVVEVAGREAAIRAGLDRLQGGDLMVVAGKGHEQGQIVGTVTHPFDDGEVVWRLCQDQ